MKKLLLGLAVIFPVQLLAADDSVYSWGAWADGIKPAAGPVANITPAPAQKPLVNIRPNEAGPLTRTSIITNNPPVITPLPVIGNVDTSQPIATSPPSPAPAPPPVPGA